QTAAQALIDVVSPGGSIFMPTFNYGELAYDAITTPSLTGAITETFRKLPDVARSDHPTHPMAGFGPDAANILREHRPLNVFGVGSPLWRLWQRKAWVMLIGCDHRSNSMIHVAEEFVGVTYLKRTRVGRLIRNGVEESIEVRRPGCSESFNVMDAALRRTRAIVDARIGLSNLMLMRSMDLVRAASEMLRSDPTALLCPPGQCPV